MKGLPPRQSSIRRRVPGLGLVSGPSRYPAEISYCNEKGLPSRLGVPVTRLSKASGWALVDSYWQTDLSLEAPSGSPWFLLSLTSNDAFLAFRADRFQRGQWCAEMAANIDFYFDFLSPYAYLAHCRLPALATRYGYQIAYRPIDLQQAKLSVGNTGPANRELPIKHRHLRLDLQRWAKYYGVPLTTPAGYGSHRLNRGAFYAIDRGVAARYVGTAWQLVWGEGGAMNDDRLLASVAERMEWDADEFFAFTASDTASSQLRAMNDMAFEHGVFGVPTMRVDDQMWWGNDRLRFLEMHLQEMTKK
jgi:2-hydroxychromene-2-carboxylate isomerase